MSESLERLDFELILTSLEFTRLKFENTNYPTYEFRQSQLQRVDSAMAKVRTLRDGSVDKPNVDPDDNQ